MRELTLSANRANATLYTIDPRGLAGVIDAGPVPRSERVAHLHPEDARARCATWRRRPAASRWSTPTTFDGELKRIDAETSDYYVLGFYSSNPDPAKRTRTLDVKVDRPNVTVASRRAYSLKTPGKPPAPPPLKPKEIDLSAIPRPAPRSRPSHRCTRAPVCVNRSASPGGNGLLPPLHELRVRRVQQQPPRLLIVRRAPSGARRAARSPRRHACSRCARQRPLASRQGSQAPLRRCQLRRSLQIVAAQVRLHQQLRRDRRCGPCGERRLPRGDRIRIARLHRARGADAGICDWTGRSVQLQRPLKLDRGRRITDRVQRQAGQRRADAVFRGRDRLLDEKIDELPARRGRERARSAPATARLESMPRSRSRRIAGSSSASRRNGGPSGGASASSDSGVPTTVKSVSASRAVPAMRSLAAIFSR